MRGIWKRMARVVLPPCIALWRRSIRLMHERLVGITRIWSGRRTIRWAVLVALVAVATSAYMIIRPAPEVDPETDRSSQAARHDATMAGWSYMPGVAPEADGLHVSYLGRSIVQQNGTPGQDNPPVNVYGTHLAGSGDATLRFVAKDLKGDAVIRLYDAVPLVSDEFRREPDSIEIVLSKETVHVSRWQAYDGGSVYRQQPVDTRTTSYEPANIETVSAHRQGSHWTISLNDTAIYTTQGKDVLSGDVWFGLSAPHLGDSWTLQALEGQFAQGVRLEDVSRAPLPSKSADGLQELARHKRPGFVVGAATALGPLVADKDYARLALGGNFGQLTTENAMKWQFVHPQPTVYDFHEADAIVALARRANIAVQGHTLVFGEANPVWVEQLPTATDSDKARVRDVMVDHITQTVGHFKARIASWDVVNEPLAAYDTPAGVDGLRQHIWYRSLGEDYIATAFTAARQADPDAKLFINDFGLESDGDRWQTFLALMTKLKAHGVPIDGVGFQAHVYAPGDGIDPATLRSHIQALAKLGLVSRISEMDVHDDNGADAQAKQFAAVFEACLSERSCLSWSTWGVTDRYDVSLDGSGHMVFGSDFLWDKNAHPKQALSAINELLGQ